MMTGDQPLGSAGPAVASGLAAVARERAVMATVADVIVAAAAGKSLRVAVGCSGPGESLFADQLTRALVARGRACRCATAKPPVDTDARAAGDQPNSQPNSQVDGQVDGQVGPTVAVITSGTVGSDDTDLCRINIEVYPPVPAGARDDAADAAHTSLLPAQAAGPAGGNDCQPDIVIDYRHPAGPTIRHMTAALAEPQAGHR